MSSTKNLLSIMRQRKDTSLTMSGGSSTNSRRSSTSLALLAWGGITVSTCVIRWLQKRRQTRREEFVAQNGGLLPQARNAVHALEIRASLTPDKLALTNADGISTVTWNEYNHQVQQFARALKACVPDSDEHQYGVAVHAFNEPRWFFSALGAMAAGWTVSGIYLTNTYDQASHVLKTSKVKVLILESRELLETVYKTVLQDFSTLTVVLLNGGNEDASSRTPSYQAFVSCSKNSSIQLPSPSELSDDAVASLVYTSGTTGNPKAVELTNNNITSVCAMMHARIPLDENTRVVSYLPLSHIAAMGIDLFSSLYCGAHVYFADSNALKGSLKDTLLRVRPTLFFGVPTVWQKMETAMTSAAAKSYSKTGSGPVLKAIGSLAKTVGATWWNFNTPELVRCSLVVPFALFRTIAFKKVRRGCGLDQCKLLYTGAAPLPVDTMNYLRSLDMPLLEVFGMSESTGAIAVCGPNDRIRPLGACGRALPHGTLEIAISDGEILWKGDNNMLGYKGLPAATQAALSSATGQLHTGDIGMIDDLGYLFITGRKKDLIITAGGENIAPTPIEEQLLSLIGTEHAGHVLLIGDARKFLSVLVAPCENGAIPPAVIVEAAMNEYNTSYAKSRAQKVQKAHVLEFPFTVSSGELTPTMKVKRAAIVTKFRNEIDAMYSDDSVKLVGYSSMNIGSITEPSIA